METEEQCVKVLKKLTSTKKYELNKDAFSNIFIAGEQMVPDIVGERKQMLAKDQKKLNIILMAVEFFTKRQMNQLLQLDRVSTEKVGKDRRNNELRRWEKDYNNEANKTYF